MLIDLNMLFASAIGAGGALLGVHLANRQSIIVQKNTQEYETAERKKQNAVSRLEEALECLVNLNTSFSMRQLEASTMLVESKIGKIDRDPPKYTGANLGTVKTIVSTYANELYEKIESLEATLERQGAIAFLCAAAAVGTDKQKENALEDLEQQGKLVGSAFDDLISAIPQYMRENSLI